MVFVDFVNSLIAGQSKCMKQFRNFARNAAFKFEPA